MSANILYRVSDGVLLEANFGEVSKPGPGEALLVLDEIPDFKRYRVLDGKVVERDKAALDAERAGIEKHQADLDNARSRLIAGKGELADVVADLRMLALG